MPLAPASVVLGTATTPDFIAVNIVVILYTTIAYVIASLAGEYTI
jgi:hypothetical protein